MKSETNTPVQLFNTIIGIDLGDTKHAVCVTEQNGNIHKEYSIQNTRSQIEKLAKGNSDALIALEVGTN